MIASHHYTFDGTFHVDHMLALDFISLKTLWSELFSYELFVGDKGAGEL